MEQEEQRRLQSHSAAEKTGEQLRTAEEPLKDTRERLASAGASREDWFLPLDRLIPSASASWGFGPSVTLASCNLGLKEFELTLSRRFSAFKCLLWLADVKTTLVCRKQDTILRPGFFRPGGNFRRLT